MCLHAKISRENAEAVVAQRSEEKNEKIQAFTGTDKFIEFLANEVYGDAPTNNKEKKEKSDFIHDIEKFQLGVKSEYYEFTAQAEIGSSRLTVKSLLRSATANANSNNNTGADTNSEVETLRRGIGVY